MQTEFGLIAAEKYTELHDRYAPLTAAVRDLVDASLTTGVGGGGGHHRVVAPRPTGDPAAASRGHRASGHVVQSRYRGT